MHNLKRFTRYQLPAIIWALLLFIQSSIPNFSTPSLGITFQDKIGHVIIFAILGFFVTRAFLFSGNLYLMKNAIVLGMICGILFALSDEFHQSFVPGRYSELGDLIADMIGIALAQLFFRLRRFQPD